MSRMLQEGCLGSRYLFESALQATLHRVAHSHFGLSSAVLKDDCIIMGIQISENYVVDTTLQLPEWL
eukprot:1911987-Amphidinium_carterae.1